MRICFLVGGDVEDVLKVPRKENAFALGHAIWLDDVGDFGLLGLSEVLLKESAEVIAFIWQYPCSRKEAVLIRVAFLQAAQVARKLVFLREADYPWVHVHFLPRVQFA